MIVEFYYSGTTPSMPDLPESSETAVGDFGNPALLGARVRDLRKAAGLTLDQASETTGVSRAALSKIERGEMSPTYDSLCKLARGLKVDLATLVSGQRPTGGGVAVTRAGAGAVQQTERFLHRLIAPDLANRAMYVFETEIRATSLDDYDRWDRHDSEDTLHVLEGTAVVYLEGRDPVTLGIGDTLQMDGRIRHAILAAGTGVRTRILWISVPARH